jgi:hypothetical protein
MRVLVVAGAAKIRAALAFVFGFVEGWVADYVFFAGPIAEVGETAAFAAEGEIGVCFGAGWFVANGAEALHGSSE